MVGETPARKYFTGLKHKPQVGDVFEIIDKQHFLKPVRVQLTEIKTHTGAGDIYFVKILKDQER
jgi:hypothetical protein